MAQINLARKKTPPTPARMMSDIFPTLTALLFIPSDRDLRQFFAGLRASENGMN